MLHRLLEHPLTRGHDLDSPETTQLRKRIIQEKPFLRKIYVEWYQTLLAEVGASVPGSRILELGSGAGFLEQLSTNVITSDLILVDDLNLILDAQRPPFSSASLTAMLMTNVLHHIPDPSALFRSAARTIKPGGKIAMIEPWITPWANFVYRRLHHEPVIADAPDWTIQGEGPLSGANTALPWIIFSRDRSRFEHDFPQWKIETIKLFMPFRYLLSGGISLRSLMPSFSFGFWRGVENALDRSMQKLAMFALIVLVRK
jgi:SAM-dependent methyltransferase